MRLLKNTVGDMGGNTWQLETKTTLLVLTVQNNRPAVKEFKSKAHGFNHTQKISEFPLMGTLIGGESNSESESGVFELDWKYKEAYFDESLTAVTLVFTNDSLKLEMRSVWKAESGVGPIEHSMELFNLSGEKITITQQESMHIDFQNGTEPVIWRFAKESGEAEGIFGRKGQGIYKDPLVSGTSFIAPTNTENTWNSNGYIPIIYADYGDHGFYLAWEWPHGRVLAEHDAENGMSASAGLNAAFKTDIPAGKSFVVPTAYLGAYGGDVDDGSNEFKRWFFNYKVPDHLRENENEPLTQSDDQFDVTEERFGKIGLESLKWEYGWWSDEQAFPKDRSRSWMMTLEGDWKLRNPGYIAKLENLGFGTIGEYGALLDSMGIKFSLYVLLHDSMSETPGALTSVGPNGRPEWFSDRTITVGRSAELGDEDCVAWLKTRLLDLFEEYNVTTWRNDFEPVSPNSRNINRHAYKSLDNPYWNAVGFYEILDYLYSAKPGFRYDNCGSGGSMKDYATMRRSSFINNDDSAHILSLRVTLYDASYCLPPMQLQSPCDTDTFCADSQSGRYVYPLDPDYGFRSLLYGAYNFASWTGTVQYGHYEKYYAMYKEKVRHLVRYGNLYHILPRPDNIHWDGVQYYDAEASKDIKGAAFIFKPSEKEGDTKNIRFKGLESGREYSLVFEDRKNQNTVKTGAELMGSGLDVTIEGEAGSEIIWIYHAEP